MLEIVDEVFILMKCLYIAIQKYYQELHDKAILVQALAYFRVIFNEALHFIALEYSIDFVIITQEQKVASSMISFIVTVASTDSATKIEILLRSNLS